MSITGDYTQNGGILEVKIAGYDLDFLSPVPDGTPEMDTYFIDGDALLNGTLNVVVKLSLIHI